MGKKKAATSPKSQRTTKASLAAKAAKAVAAVALGVGNAIAAKRTKRKTSAKVSTPTPPIEEQRSHPPTHEEIAVRAYFISEAHRAAGLPANPHQDWLEAESELLNPPNHRSS